MEFIQKIRSPLSTPARLRDLLALNRLAALCTSIHAISTRDEDRAEIECLWGVFDLRRDEIRHGVRFSLLDCPHALAWTITHDAQTREIIIHCTIDKTEADPDFIESIEEFVSDWARCLAVALAPLPPSGGT